MLGWHVSVYRQQNDGAKPAVFGAPRGQRLAVWQADVFGLRWLDDLVQQGEAIDLGGCGYPNEYTARAEDIISRIRDGEPPNANPLWGFDPGDILGEGWLGQTTKDLAVMAACRSDEWLIIRAWDES